MKMISNDEILFLLEKAGYKSYLVGGCLRDSLLNKESHDVDICTQALPDEILEVFKDYKTIDIGKKFGTIKVIYGDFEYEITTMRKESSYNDKRHPDKVDFTKDIVEDLKRRDFTINAMAKRKDEIIDPFDGQADLKKKIIRAVGDPVARINEDLLRSLRAVRFATSLDFQIEENLKKAIKNKASSINEISKERIREEINKILLSNKPSRGIRLLDELGLLEFIFPEVFRTKGFNQHSTFHKDDVYNHSLNVLDKTKANLNIRMAALYHDVGKIDTFFLDENGEGRFFGHQKVSENSLRERLKILKYSNKFIEDTTILVRRHMDNTNTYTKKSVRKLLRNLGEENLLNLFDLQKADVLSTTFSDASNIDLGLKILEEVKNDEIPKNRSEIAINGKDLILLGYKEGVELGNKLKDIENLIYDEKLKNNKDDIIKYIKENR
ncbi:CCA tRNA nucleotidyltransferase [Anaerococcus sp. Marseille-P3625]|uniref:CCA tRNA nucleotidyltransferase n=1 Tax=Anaerococcus sp. Marseille-P3625 TaxID=1977277 RepID=UPI0015DE9B0D|nr:HD domain-containing protein [Anaerococcus sp. Marseille-P3625]